MMYCKIQTVDYNIIGVDPIAEVISFLIIFMRSDL